MKIGIIGGGNLGSSLARGFLKSGVLKREDISISDPDRQKLRDLGKLGIRTTNNKEAVKNSDVVFIAVKPDTVKSILEEVNKVSENRLFVSAAVGVSTEFIEKRTKARVIRVMPNICGEVAEMASCYSLGKRATPEDGELVERLLGGIGTTFKVDEEMMDSVTGLSGSGPAYFYLFIKALHEAGAELGLPDGVALKLAAQTAKGAGETVLKTGKNPGELIKQVCTPKGTTIEGIKVLEREKVSEAIKKAVKAAARRANELSK